MSDLEQWVAGLGEVQRCSCGHREGSHLFGRRSGLKVRTRCTHGDALGACLCRLFTKSSAEIPSGGNPLPDGANQAPPPGEGAKERLR